MRFSFLAAIVLVSTLSLASTCAADSVHASPRSNYGQSGLISGSGSECQPTFSSCSETDTGGFVETLDCASNACSGPISLADLNLVEVDIPNLAPGTTIDIAGLGDYQALLCDTGTLFATACDTPDLTCLNSLNPSFSATGVFQISAASCTSVSSLGNAMELVFSSSSFSTSSSATPPTAAPEPSSLLLLGMGLFGLLTLKRSAA
jgi:hypothetical protein